MRRLSKKAKLGFALVSIAAILLTCSGIWWNINRTGYRKVLPWSAHNIHDQEWDTIIPASYCTLTRADMPESEMPGYMERIELKPLSAAMIASPPNWLSWDGCKWWEDGSPLWWNPTPNMVGIYSFTFSDHEWAYAKWENGRVYVKSYQLD